MLYLLKLIKAHFCLLVLFWFLLLRHRFITLKWVIKCGQEKSVHLICIRKQRIRNLVKNLLRIIAKHNNNVVTKRVYWAKKEKKEQLK